LLIARGAVLIGWYLVGNEVIRRRSRRLAAWAKRALDPLGGAQSVRWLSTQSFRLEVERPRAPFRSAALVGLAESWDVPMIWLWNRRHGRRDMVLLHADLRQQPIWGLELFRPGSLLAGDARHLASQEGWAEEPLAELRLAVELVPDGLHVLVLHRQPIADELGAVAADHRAVDPHVDQHPADRDAELVEPVDEAGDHRDRQRLGQGDEEEGGALRVGQQL